MNRLNKSQKSQVGQVRAVTGCTDKVALECMAASNWNVESAVDIYYSSGLQAAAAPAPRAAQPSRSAVEKLFQKYVNPTEGCIMAEGVGSFCEDLDVDPSDIVTLVISWHFRAATMCEFSKEEFMDGMIGLRCDTLDKLKQKLPELRAELRDDAKFRLIYDYAYPFSCEKGQKCVQLDTAIGMWRLLFAEHSWPLLDQWCDYLLKHHKRAVSKDTWVQLLDFCNMKPDFRNWDSSGAWPYLIDEFAEQCVEEQAGRA